MTRLYAIHIVATGEVRDADGNLVETVPIDEVMEVELTPEQYAALTNPSNTNTTQEMP